MQSVLLMIFFLSIGISIEFVVIINNTLLIFSLLLISMVFKAIASIVLLKLFSGRPLALKFRHSIGHQSNR